MKDIWFSLLAGLLLGGAFKLLKLPLPAPPVFAGIVGILGIYLGGLGVEYLLRYFAK